MQGQLCRVRKEGMRNDEAKENFALCFINKASCHEDDDEWKKSSTIFGRDTRRK
jgi:hypothetical protein